MLHTTLGLSIVPSFCLLNRNFPPNNPSALSIFNYRSGFYRMVEHFSLFCQTTINHTMTQSNASKGPSGRFVFNCPVACNSLELFCTCLCNLIVFCLHARSEE